MIAKAAAAFLIFFAGAVPSFAQTPHWTDENAASLLHVAEGVDVWGLAPASNDIEQLKTALAGDDAVAIELAASELFTRIARDISDGATPQSARRRWRVEKTPLDEQSVADAMERALADGDIEGALNTLAPHHSEYRALAAAFLIDGETESKRVLRANMERWRWMPSDLGAEYILVNVPSFEAIHIRNGEEISRRRVIAGTTKTPTPQFAATITGVAINPTWYVPASIVEESVGALLKNKPKEAARLGYYVAADGGVRQKPGPSNALGLMKLVMPNPYSVFVHDTPNRKLFDKEKRALSHGCLRIDDALGFATELLGEEWDREMIEAVVDTGSTAVIDIPAPLPIYIGYFTAMTTAAGEVVFYPDIYRLDEKILGDAASGVEASSNFASLCIEGAKS